jgi:fatty-acid desaturase
LSKQTEQLARAAAIGVAAGAMDTAAVTLWLHRSKTHGAYKLNPKLEMAARVIVWGSGTNPREWAQIHRRHHDFADTSDDPHSPVQEGKWGVEKLWAKNTPKYGKEAKRVTAQQDFPPDLQPDKLDKALFNNKRLGLAASLAGHVILNKVAGNPGYMGAVSFAAEKAFYVMGGNFVNSIGHSGAKPAEALVTGNITPHEDGSYGADSAWVAAMTLGEGRQKAHHDHPESVFFGPLDECDTLPKRLLQDMGGTAALALIEGGYATFGDGPPASEQPSQAA